MVERESKKKRKVQRLKLTLMMMMSTIIRKVDKRIPFSIWDGFLLEKEKRMFLLKPMKEPIMLQKM